MSWRTTHLDLTDDGFVGLHDHPDACLLDWLSCGWIGAASWPSNLGPAPEWFWSELETLREWWDEEQQLELEEVGRLWESLSLAEQARSDRREVMSW